MDNTGRMKLRTHVVLKTSYPDEETWMENGNDLLRGPGFKTASILVEMLSRAGFKVSRPCERDYYGWEFHVSGGLQFVITFGLEETKEGEESLLLQSYTFFLRKLLVPKKLSQLHRDVLSKIDEFLKLDGRFRDIRWFTFEEYDSKERKDGHPDPFASQDHLENR